jgi:hypothetical protein
MINLPNHLHLNRKIQMNGYLLLAIFSLLFSEAHAQTPDKKWNIGLMAGFSVYSGEYGNSMRDFRYESTRQDPTAGLNISSYISPSFDAAINSSFGSFGYYSNAFNDFLIFFHLRLDKS